MSEEPKSRFRYRVLRYMPDLIRDEWINVGLLLEDPADGLAGAPRRVFRAVEEPSEIARVKRLHPEADEGVLRGLAQEFDSILSGDRGDVSAAVERLDGTLSNAFQFSLPKGVEAGDFDAELDRLYRAHVAVPARSRGVVESTRAWIKKRVNDVFLRRRVPKLERNIAMEGFTEPGDPLKLDYGYQNGVRGFLHAVALGRDIAPAKILAYTAERVRAKVPGCEFTAITEAEPSRENRRHEFIERLFVHQRIALVPLSRIDKFAEDLRPRLQ